jgi:hypothetical protein
MRFGIEEGENGTSTDLMDEAPWVGFFLSKLSNGWSWMSVLRLVVVDLWWRSLSRNNPEGNGGWTCQWSWCGWHLRGDFWILVLVRDELYWKARKCLIHYSSPTAVRVVGCPHLHGSVHLTTLAGGLFTLNESTIFFPFCRCVAMKTAVQDDYYRL